MASMTGMHAFILWEADGEFQGICHNLREKRRLPVQTNGIFLEILGGGIMIKFTGNLGEQLQKKSISGYGSFFLEKAIIVMINVTFRGKTMTPTINYKFYRSSFKNSVQ